jgi:hypothetical protein
MSPRVRDAVADVVTRGRGVRPAPSASRDVLSLRGHSLTTAVRAASRSVPLRGAQELPGDEPAQGVLQEGGQVHSRRGACARPSSHRCAAAVAVPSLCCSRRVVLRSTRRSARPFRRAPVCRATATTRCVSMAAAAVAPPPSRCSRGACRSCVPLVRAARACRSCLSLRVWCSTRPQCCCSRGFNALPCADPRARARHPPALRLPRQGPGTQRQSVSRRGAFALLTCVVVCR